MDIYDNWNKVERKSSQIRNLVGEIQELLLDEHDDKRRLIAVFKELKSILINEQKYYDAEYLKSAGKQDFNFVDVTHVYKSFQNIIDKMNEIEEKVIKQ